MMTDESLVQEPCPQDAGANKVILSASADVNLSASADVNEGSSTCGCGCSNASSDALANGNLNGVASEQEPCTLRLPSGKVTSINVSERKGTRKTPLESGEAQITISNGVVGDAHAGDWHRQVSFLAEESIQKARDAGLDVKEGDFAENFTTEGISLFTIPVGTLLQVGETEVEISQIGKVCHTRCAIYHLAGDCIFPREGIFGVVRREGKVRVGDKIQVLAWGNGTCDATPPEALAEVEAARAAGTL
ncbi:MAG: hypothetical protein LBG97_01765 [Coriobacteriales bacterium]|jgi:MOSC domain-containing protein YiiM|nr:hypothetical protein [Coriobacteriales bacterium]